MNHETGSPAKIWQTALGQLQVQLPKETFNTWLRNARLLAYEDGTFIIAVDNIYAREWLEHRLRKVIHDTLEIIAGRSVELRFVLWPDKKKGREQDVYSAGPLLAEIAPKVEPQPQFEYLAPGENGLNPRQTFDNFAVGASNRFAYTAAKAVAEAPATQFNPLYIYSGVGLGKTHLLHAIGNACQERGAQVLYITGETFTNDLVAAIRTKHTADFREKYRQVDILLVDDVQFIGGKDSTQEEFYHTFNTLFNANAQVIMASTRLPGSIPDLDLRLRSRFEGGLIVELQPPDFLTRVDIIELKAEQRGFAGRLSLDVLEAIAEKIGGSVRELEGALNRVIATAMLSGEANVEDVQSALANTVQSCSHLSLEDILMAAADFYGVSPEEITGRARSRDVSIARQVVMYLAREESDCSLQQIGEQLGGRNHSTVLYSCERVADLMSADTILRRQVRSILQMLRPVSSDELPDT